MGSNRPKEEQERDGHPDPQPQQVEGIVTALVDLEGCRRDRLGWGLFRDRRPEQYGALARLG